MRIRAVYPLSHPLLGVANWLKNFIWKAIIACPKILAISGASDYKQKAKKAVAEMHSQVGLHKTNEQGFAVRSLMIWHLVMPNQVAGTEKFVRWVAENLPKSTYVNTMDQYHVDYKAFQYPKIWRSITAEEYLESMGWAEQYGLTNLDSTSVAVRDFFIQHKNQRSAIKTQSFL